MLGKDHLSRARRIGGPALADMWEQDLPAVVVEELDIDPGLPPEGRSPQFEDVAREIGTHLHYLRLCVDNPRTYVVAFSGKSELTDAEKEAAVGLAAQERPQ